MRFRLMLKSTILDDFKRQLGLLTASNTCVFRSPPPKSELLQRRAALKTHSFLVFMSVRIHYIKKIKKLLIIR